MTGADDFRVVVVVGTDHHRFDRLIHWIDEWVAHAAPGVDAVVQHGHAAAPARAHGRSLIPHAELQQLMAAASVVVTHGGPATIVEARRLGHRPLVVPRDPARDEHVDGHQIRFSRRLGEQGLVVVCETREELLSGLDAARADPSSVRLDTSATAGDEAVRAAVDSVGRIVDALAAQARARRRR